MEAKLNATPMGINSIMDVDRYVLDITDESVKIHAKFHGCPTESHFKVA